METKSFTPLGGGPTAAGKLTRIPFMWVWLRLTIIKLASRKNMMSINGMISMRARLCGIGEDNLIFTYLLGKIQYDVPVIVKVIGILTLETITGLNRHCRNALVAALSNIGLPMLCAMEALVTLPLPGSTSTTQTPLPVT